MKKKLFVLLITLLAIFTVNVKADTKKINITNVKIIDKSETATVEEPVLEGNAIKSSVKFNQINDYVIYEITLENNDSYDYSIDKVYDDNENSNISIEYDYSEELLTSGKGTLRAKFSYKKKLINVEKITLDGITITMDLTKSDGTKTTKEINGEVLGETKTINPKTGDNLYKYIILLIISIVGIVFTFKKIKIKNIKVGLLLLVLPILMLPFIIKAAEKFEINIVVSEVEIKGEFEVYDIKIGDDERKITYGQKIGELSDPEIEGYDLVKWVDEDGNTITEDTVITKPIEVTPVLKTIEYTIAYNLDGGSAINKLKYTVEDEFTLTNPTKEGYTFSGWTGSNGDDLQTSVTILKGTTGNKTYNANYSTNQDTAYKVIHKYQKLNGTYEEVVQNLTGATDTKVTPQVIGRTGFNSPEPEEKTITGDGKTTFEYIYTRIEYQVNLDNEYIETDAETKSYPYGTQITARAADREGYNFTGWSNNETTQEITITVTGDITLVPNYQIIKYIVTFDANSGLCGEASREVNYNTKIGDLPNATKVGYVVEGWYNGNTKVDKNFIPTGNVTLTAHWVKSVDSMIIENTNLEVINGNTVQINITILDEMGETFTFTSNNTTIATVNSIGLITGVKAGTATITITGDISGQTKEVSVTVKPATYTVTFDPTNIGQVTKESISVNEGEYIYSFPYATPIDKSYKFVGWFNGNNKETAAYRPTGNITLTAHYEEIPSFVTYTDSNNSGVIDQGDYVKIGDDGFYVIEKPEYDTIKLLAEYNLDWDARQSADANFTYDFSNDNYWKLTSASSSSSGHNPWDFVADYDYDNYGSKYIYRTNQNENTPNNLYFYIDAYKDYLEYDVGQGGIADVRLMSYAEAVDAGCDYYYDYCPTYMTNQEYWLGSSYSRDEIWYISSASNMFDYLYYRNNSGIRPVVEINLTDISNYYFIDLYVGGEQIGIKAVPNGSSINVSELQLIDGWSINWYTDYQYINKITESITPTEDTIYYGKKA